MLDLHCHLLHGVDDGPADVATAAEMARVLARVGFTTIATSPHAGDGPGGDVPCAHAESRRIELQTELNRLGIELCLLPGAEHMVGPRLLDRFAAGEITPIGGRGKWLFVELPWGGISDPETALFRLQSKGWRLLMAHPERCGYLDRAQLQCLVDRGVRFQLELGSFIGRYGREAEHAAIDLADRGLGHVLATDLHHPDGAEEWLRAALAAVSARYGDDAVSRALISGPKAILAGANSDDLPPFVVTK